MAFLLNLIFGVFAGFISDYVMQRMGMPDPAKVVIAVLIGLAVFLANLAKYAVGM